MNILVLESGANCWGLAVVRIEQEVEPLAITVQSEPRALARELFAHMRSTLDDAGIALDEIDALAVGIGPGSWTGLRVGLTAMKTLAQTREIPLAGIPAFDPIAQAVWRARKATATALLLVTSACRPGELYGKIFECGEDYLGIVQGEWIGSPQLLADTLSTEALARGLEAPHLLAGEESQSIGKILRDRSEEYSALEISFEQILIELAIAGAAAISAGDASDPMKLSPLYLAPSNAERNLLNR